MKRGWKAMMALAGSNLGLKLFSLVFALGLWLYVNAGQKAVERAMEVPVELRNIPSNVMVGNPELGKIEVRVMGPPALLSTMDPDRLKVILDLDGARPGTSTFRLSPDFFNPPRGVKITRISPSVVNLVLELMVTRSLPVTVRFVGKPPFGYKVAHVETDPETIKIRGPARELNPMISLETLPVKLEGIKKRLSREVHLSSTGKSFSLSRDRVTVSVTVKEEWVTKEFSHVEVKVKNFEGSYRISPRRVTLRLSGPKRIIEQLQVGAEQVYLDLNGLKPGKHTLALGLDLPEEIEVLEQKPDRFKVRILKPKK
ncbi:MAG: YbbR-like domain-containing protein [Candidatus Binatia bacterium]